MKKFYLKLLIIVLVVLSSFFLLIVVYRHNSHPQSDILEETQNNASCFSTSTNQGEKIVDSSTGFNFLLPEDWKIEKMSKSMVFMSFASSTYLKENPEMKCRVVFQSSKLSPNKSFDLKVLKNSLQKNIFENYPDAQNVTFNIINIADYPALQTSFDFKNADSFDKFFIVDIIHKGNLFDFSGVFSNLKSKEQETVCKEGMDQIVRTITME